eukprot:2200589-Karenia_brevis.AAC.1
MLSSTSRPRCCKQPSHVSDPYGTRSRSRGIGSKNSGIPSNQTCRGESARRVVSRKRGAFRAGSLLSR